MVKVLLAFGLILFLVLPASAAGFKQPRAKWLTSFRNEFKTEVCYSKSYVRQCMNLEANRCGSAVNTALSSCIKKSKLPKSIDPLLEGVGMGESLGRCVGLRLNKKLKLKKNANKECYNVASW